MCPFVLIQYPFTIAATRFTYFYASVLSGAVVLFACLLELLVRATSGLVLSCATRNFLATTRPHRDVLDVLSSLLTIWQEQDSSIDTAQACCYGQQCYNINTIRLFLL